MSIQHVAAVLDSRKPDLSGTRKLVLITLANRTDAKGVCWPSQDLIAGECGVSLRAVSDHLKALDDAGYITRKTKHLGQGNGSRTTYRIHLEALSDTPRNGDEQPDIAPEEFAHAEFAHAKTVVCTGSTPRVTNLQEPTLSNTNVLDDAREKKTKPSRRRGKRISENWSPTPKDYAFATKKGLTTQEIQHEADRFRDYWLGKAGSKAAKLDWEATWRNWVTSDFGPVARKAKQAANARGSQSISDHLDRVAYELDARSQPHSGGGQSSQVRGNQRDRATSRTEYSDGRSQSEIIDVDGHVLARAVF